MSLPFALEREYALLMAQLQENPVVIDWTDCPLVEVIPGKVSGVPLLKGTRLPADTILENYQGGSPLEEISENFDTPIETVREILAYAGR